jgi:ankyrin repeat protein
MKFSLLSSISSTTFLTVVTLSAAVHAREEEAIFQAVDTNDPEKIREALSKHANNLNAIGPGGQTPLMNAVLRGKGKAVKTLLELGADATIGEKDGYTREFRI